MKDIHFYIVGTPIGNLGDMSPRALEALRSADAVYAEDTRVTGKLLAAFGKTLYIGDLKNVELEDVAEPAADNAEPTGLQSEDPPTE